MLKKLVQKIAQSIAKIVYGALQAKSSISHNDQRHSKTTNVDILNSVGRD